MVRKLESWLLGIVGSAALLAFPASVGAVPVTLSDVPAYNWYHGCGPTAAASVLGYWDLHGYSNLFTASGTDVFLTANVQDQISSPAHNARYDPTPDDTTKPQSWNSIADWFRTSADPLQFGWSYLSYANDAFVGYSAYRGYTFAASTVSYESSLWNSVVAEIKAGSPLMFLVDSTGDGVTDHFVPVLGYDDRGAGDLWYGIYTTWSEGETIVWEQFHAMANGAPWGVGYATFVDPVPEPSTLLLLSLGLAGLIGMVRRRRHE